jgi:DNA-directed RNA polymerase II subunit RPB1
MNSDSNDDNLVLRLRFKDLSDEWIPPEERAIRDDIDYYDTAVHFLRQIEDSVLHELTLKGIPEISKVYAKKYNETEYDVATGNTVTTQDNWMLETDGVAL